MSCFVYLVSCMFFFLVDDICCVGCLFFFFFCGHAFVARRMVPLCFISNTVFRFMVPELGPCFSIFLCFSVIVFVLCGVICVSSCFACLCGAIIVFFFDVCMCWILVLWCHLAFLVWWFFFNPTCAGVLHGSAA